MEYPRGGDSVTEKVGRRDQLEGIGRCGLDCVLLGSVAEKTVQVSLVAVLSVRCM